MTACSLRFPIPIVEAGQAPFYLAEDRGFFKDEGIEPEFGLASPGADPLTAVASGKDLIGVLGGPDTLVAARSRGLELKAIAILHHASNFPCLITLKSSGITTLEALKGLRVGYYDGHISTDVLRCLFRAEGIEHTEVDVGFDYRPLLAGEVDAQWAFTVTAGMTLPAQGVDINIIHPKDYGITTHGYTLFAREDVLAGNREWVFSMLRASLRGVVAAVENPAAAMESLLRRTPGDDPELLLAKVEKYNEVVNIDHERRVGMMHPEWFQAASERLRRSGVMGEDGADRDCFTTDLLEQIHSETG